MPMYLESRATRIGDMAAALYWALDDAGPRLPARREIARRALVSEATISRRLRDASSDEKRLVTRLVGARARTYPPDSLSTGLARWIPDDPLEVRDARVWITCLSFAAWSEQVVTAVREAWDVELTLLDSALRRSAGDRDVAADAEAVQALLLGLSIGRALDPELSHERALALLDHVLSALGHPEAA